MGVLKAGVSVLSLNLHRLCDGLGLGFEKACCESKSKAIWQARPKLDLLAFLREKSKGQQLTVTAVPRHIVEFWCK